MIASALLAAVTTLAPVLGATPWANDTELEHTVRTLVAERL